MTRALKNPIAGRLLSAAAAVLAVVILMLAGMKLSMSASEEAHRIPAPAVDETPGQAISEVAVIAGGCFWGVQGVFQHVAGVTNAVSGYTGGDKSTAHYSMVSTGTTGHAESVQITFDPRRLSYGRILQIYFSVAHNPTQLNRQGPDAGTQYRSAIFPRNAEQARVAKAYIAQLNKAHVYDAPIVTRIEPGRTFYPAETHHQNFMERNPANPYILVNDQPKIRALKHMFPDRYRADAVLVATD